MDIFVQEAGPASALPIVFLHGGGGAGWMWQPVVDQLSDYHCLVPDLPEHGKSLGIKPFSIRDSSKRIADLIRSRVPAQKAHLVGLSLGAQVLVELLSYAPEVIDHAIISSANLRPLPGTKLGMYSEAVMAAAYWSAIAPLKWCDPWIRLNMKSSVGSSPTSTLMISAGTSAVKPVIPGLIS